MRDYQSENTNHENNESEIEKIVKEKITSYILAAFGLVAGLAWNEAVKALIEYMFPARGNTLVAKFAYALGLTIILALISIHLAGILKKEEKK